MKIKDVLALPTNELSLVLEGLVFESVKLKVNTESAVDDRRKKRAAVSKKIVKITLELKRRGWEAIEYDGIVKFEPISNSNKQESLI